MIKDNKIENFNKHIKSSTICLDIDMNDISDGYHTFGELYQHRHNLFISLCRSQLLLKKYTMEDPTIYVVKSKEHHDGLDVWNKWGMFIVQLYTHRSGQISYHLPNEYWDKCDFIPYLPKANEWDGHTSDDVLERLLLI